MAQGYRLARQTTFSLDDLNARRQEPTAQIRRERDGKHRSGERVDRVVLEDEHRPPTGLL